jgi:ABC-type polysaccharide/polyol phosphate transport system ATPase subunit
LTGPLKQAVSRPAAEQELAHVAIAARDVSKAFRLAQERHTTVKQQLLRPLTHHRAAVLPALRGVSFQVMRGETFGIVGRNGSGKSTLLKCMAQIYRLDQRQIDVAGRVAPFIELGTGFKEELTARDNVLLNLVLLGLRSAEARARFGEVMAFAELAQFADLKLKNFSSGMTLRLGVAITLHTGADVFLFDGVLKVGDASFQAKCETPIRPPQG